MASDTLNALLQPREDPFMPAPVRKFSLSLDVWAVLVSIVLALLVVTGIIKNVSW